MIGLTRMPSLMADKSRTNPGQIPRKIRYRLSAMFMFAKWRSFKGGSNEI